jgi:hypothetical protein
VGYGTLLINCADSIDVLCCESPPLADGNNLIFLQTFENRLDNGIDGSGRRFFGGRPSNFSAILLTNSFLFIMASPLFRLMFPLSWLNLQLVIVPLSSPIVRNQLTRISGYGQK